MSKFTKKNKITKVLGIETSCDETGVAIYDQHNGLLANKIHSQIETHKKYGGVVPELSSRIHIHKILPLIYSAIDSSGLRMSDIDGIAYTAGPGLVGSLMTGSVVGRSLAYSLDIPAIAVNHIEAHIMSVMLESKSICFPFIVLLVSGAHTQLIKAYNIGKYKLLGESVDDAVGEVFDKIARLLELDYPCGHSLSLLAKSGIPGRYNFPKPMINHPSLKFSFSGLKTFVKNTINSSNNDIQTKADIALAFENAIIETLIVKCCRAIDITRLKRLVVVGGVSANEVLRFNLNKTMNRRKCKVFYAHPKFCTDNGAMIAYTGLIYLQNGIQQSNLEVFVKSRWPLEDLSIV